MEREVPQTKQGSKDAPQNVVRLWDWIGPHDELVPFGRRGREQEPERPPEEVAPASFAASDAPPSAEDFWGERAGGLHDALQAPGEDWIRADNGAPRAAEQAVRRARSVAFIRPVGRFAIGSARHLRILAGPRQVVRAGATAVAVAAAAAFVISLMLGGSAAPGAGPADVQATSVLSNGVDRILRLDIPVIAPRRAPAHPAVDRHGPAATRVKSRPRYAPERVRYTPTAATTTTTVSHPQVQAATAEPGARNPPPATTNDGVSRPSSTSTDSSPPVTATGQSGALGPIQSPNG